MATFGSQHDIFLPHDPKAASENDALKRLLSEQKQATLQAIRAANDVETRLTTAQSELNEISRQNLGFSQEAVSASARRTAEIAKIRSQWQDTQLELEQQKRARMGDAARAAQKLAVLERELEATSNAARTTSPATVSRPRKTGRVIGTAAAGVVAMIGMGALGWSMFGVQPNQADRSPEAASSDPSRRVTSKPGLDVAPQRTAPIVRRREGSGPQSQFTLAFDRLDQALATSSLRRAEDKLREAARVRRGCQITWTDGHPALLFGGDRKNSNSIAGTLSQCADAVEQLH